MDITKPQGGFANWFVRFYFRDFMPRFTRLVTGSREATYLMEYYWATLDGMVDPALVLEALAASGWANPVRFTLLALAIVWSLRFQWRLAGLRTPRPARRIAAVGAVGAGLLPFCWAWMLLFVLW